jgi:Fe2+ transport system protein FeoA
VSFLAQTPRKTPVVITSVAGARAFRRRLMEMGLVPGTEVTIINVAPLGDPLEIEARACRLSIRRDEAAQISVTAVPASQAAKNGGRV